MSRLTRDETMELVSRDQILRREREQRNIYFPWSAYIEHDWQPYPVDLYSVICVMTIQYLVQHEILYRPSNHHTILEDLSPSPPIYY